MLTLLNSFRHEGMLVFKTLGLGARLTALRAHPVILDQWISKWAKSPLGGEFEG